MNKSSPLYKVIKKDTEKIVRVKMNLPLGSYNSKIDFFDLKNSKFTSVPVNKQEREARMKAIKSKMNLEVLNHFNKKCIMDNKRVGLEAEGFVFNRINPVYGINPNLRPNSFSWNEEQFNRRIAGKMILEHEENEKCKFITF